ncbi:hypothetical protein NDU88_001389 [Pleurodeles waltl]|uniref:Uncharacterized protein n=1 Tax=Pleurodeles waltl TaxID=8319 RepID=A0AAV7U690_PLEWA|nr:hypothetical protein NDU88_001389 [Pleurodeles waltl]
MLMCPIWENDMIQKIQDKGSQTLSETEQVAEHFRSYYTDLYWLQLTFDKEVITDYLAHIAMKWLMTEHRERLMAPLCLEEIQAALKDMPSRKASGTDGLMVAFCKAYQDQLTPHLATLFEEMTAGGCMPPTLCEALLVVLLEPGKPGRPEDRCSSYRPLSLMNVDMKL